MNIDKTYFNLYNQIIEFIKNNYEFDAVKLNHSHDFNFNHLSYICLCSYQDNSHFLRYNKWYITILSSNKLYIEPCFEPCFDNGKEYIFTNFSDIKNILVKTFRDSKVLTKDETLIKDIIE
jgi:hypothetical protein